MKTKIPFYELVASVAVPLCISLVLVTLMSQTSFAQKRKEVKKFKIKTMTETVNEQSDGKEIAYKANYTKYDNNGNVVEETHYLPEGGVKKKVLSKYNDNNDLTEEKIYDGADKLVQMRVISYNANKDKNVESYFDGTAKLLKKDVFSYDKNGMKSEKKVYDGDGKLTETKKYIYE